MKSQQRQSGLLAREPWQSYKCFACHSSAILCQIAPKAMSLPPGLTYKNRIGLTFATCPL